MKKLLIAVLAVAMAVSMLAVPAVVSADLGDGELSASGNGTAVWSTEQVHSGDYSAKLYVVDGSTGWAEVSIPVDIAIEDITELKFWEKIDLLGASGWDVNVILGVDCDGDGVFDSDVIDWHIGSGQHTLAALAGDSFVEMDGWGGMTSGLFATPVTYAGLSGDVDWTEVDIANVTYGWWTVKADGTGFAYFGTMAGGSFTDYLAWLDGGDDDGLIDKGMRVKVVKLVIGGSGMWVNEVAYVDDVTINGVPYAIEPPSSAVGMTAASEEAVIGISVSPTSIDFGAITSGASVSGPALTVANTGNVGIIVTADIVADTYFNGDLYFYTAALRLNGWASDQHLTPTSFGSWIHQNLFGSDPIEVTGSRPVLTGLECPQEIKADTTYTGTVVFWAEQAP